MSDRPSDGMTLDELREEFDWISEFQSRMAERISGDADVHSLADYVAKLEAENAKLRELVRDICGMACFECNPWADGFACAHWDGECRIRERMAALGIEVDA